MLFTLSTIFITLALVFYSLGVWATRVVRKDREEIRLKFHRYSLFVWAIWLVPYFGGMLMGMNQ